MKNLIKILAILSFISLNGFANSTFEKVIPNNINEFKTMEKLNCYFLETVNPATKNNESNSSIDIEKDLENIQNYKNNLESLDLKVKFMTCSNESITVDGNRIGYARTCCVGSACTVREVFFQ